MSSSNAKTGDELPLSWNETALVRAAGLQVGAPVGKKQVGKKNQPRDDTGKKAVVYTVMFSPLFVYCKGYFFISVFLFQSKGQCSFSQKQEITRQCTVVEEHNNRCIRQKR